MTSSLRSHRPSEQLRDGTSVKLGPTSCVLVTGATGLIGGEIVRALLMSEPERVWLLVRRRPGESPDERLRARLGTALIDEELSSGRLQILEGDLRNRGLSLDRKARMRMSSDVDIVIHAAGETSFMRDDRCKEANVDGLRNLLRCFQNVSRLPLVTYVGTAANAGIMENRVLHETEGCCPEAIHHNRYTQSKAWGETLLRSSKFPSLVVRPSIVISRGIPDRRLARQVLWFIPVVNEFDAVPVRTDARVDIVPIGFVVAAILGLLRRYRRHAAYHISAGCEASVKTTEINELITGHYQRPRPIQLIDPQKWSRSLYRRYVRSREQRRMFALLRYYLPFLNMNVVYDNSRLRNELDGELESIPRFQEYCGEMLDLVSLEEALGSRTWE